MPRQTLYLWKQAPFLRLLVPLIAGILLQWYLLIPMQISWCILIVSLAGILLFNLRTSFLQYRFAWLNGLLVHLLMIAGGGLVSWHNNIEHQPKWINNCYAPGNFVSAVLQEPLSEKTNSFKAEASVEALLRGDSLLAAKGNIIIYFKKDSAGRQLGYGSQVLFRKTLQAITNSGNPGAFNYQRYSLFHGIGKQVYLQQGEYWVLSEKNQSVLSNFLFAARRKVLHAITAYIPGSKEAGLAEALLLGYKDDLDKTLVQSYSNTGVVHIIAISGMHMGLIYWLLSLVLWPLKKNTSTRWIATIASIAGLWLFALLTGGGPSIMRAAVMFTCIVIGESLARKTFIYNSLAASAFLLLCINPGWLWDAGFQLSYAAVLSIVIFMKPIYHRIYFPNKIVDFIWQLAAVTLAAQVLTTPISIYHFHQFPVYFLITNLLAVPLSSIIILLEILLCAVAGWPALAGILGTVTGYLIGLMNGFIEYMERLPFAQWNNLQVNILQVLMLFGFIISIACWLLQKHRPAFITGLVFLLGFILCRSVSLIQAMQQNQLLVYNIPKHQAIDFISGQQYFFYADSSLLTDDYLQRFHLRQARIANRTSQADTLAALMPSPPFFLFNKVTIAVIDKSINYTSPMGLVSQADLVIISKNAPVQLSELEQVFHCRRFVLDASNSLYKVHKWKTEAAKLRLDCFSVVDNGAFVMNMD